MKLFDQNESALPQDQVELTRSYSDMRYELNKLSSLHHPHIIRFIGIITNPHCFVLEWAPLQSLEHQRAEHARASACICVTSILHVLLQVYDCCCCCCCYCCCCITYYSNHFTKRKGPFLEAGRFTVLCKLVGRFQILATVCYNHTLLNLKRV